MVYRHLHHVSLKSAVPVVLRGPEVNEGNLVKMDFQDFLAFPVLKSLIWASTKLYLILYVLYNTNRLRVDPLYNWNCLYAKEINLK